MANDGVVPPCQFEAEWASIRVLHIRPRYEIHSYLIKLGFQDMFVCWWWCGVPLRQGCLCRYCTYIDRGGEAEWLQHTASAWLPPASMTCCRGSMLGCRIAGGRVGN